MLFFKRKKICVIAFYLGTFINDKCKVIITVMLKASIFLEYFTITYSFSCSDYLNFYVLLRNMIFFLFIKHLIFPLLYVNIKINRTAGETKNF